METKQIHVVSSKTIGETFLGVFPSDRLPAKAKRQCSLIVNTNPSTKPGAHWVAIYVDSIGTLEYFDSYGLQPTVTSISTYISKYKKWRYNSKRIQSPLSSVCGHYCIYFLIMRSYNETMAEILKKFSENQDENDEMVTKWINDNFDLDTETFDVDFIVNQICRAMKTP